MKLSPRQRCRAFLLGEMDVPGMAPVPKAGRPVTVGSWNGMTFGLWMSSIDHIKWAQELFKQDKFRDLLSVLTNASPLVDASKLDATQAQVALGRFLGFQDLLRVLLALPRFPEAAKPEVEADYGTDDISEINV